jgi:hypothetical protein
MNNMSAPPLPDFLKPQETNCKKSNMNMMQMPSQNMDMNEYEKKRNDILSPQNQQQMFQEQRRMVEEKQNAMRKQKYYILYVSPTCNYSKKIIQYLEKQNLLHFFIILNLGNENIRKRIPKYIRSVPSMTHKDVKVIRYDNNREGPLILTGKNLLNEIQEFSNYISNGGSNISINNQNISQMPQKSNNVDMSLMSDFSNNSVMIGEDGNYQLDLQNGLSTLDSQFSNGFLNGDTGRNSSNSGNNNISMEQLMQQRQNEIRIGQLPN